MLPAVGPPVARARFDDLRGGGVSFELTGLSKVLIADRTDDVASVLDQAEVAARSGSWVAGFVTYEAAAAFDDSLHVKQPHVKQGVAAVPLAWFGVFADRVDAAPLPPAHPGSSVQWELGWDEERFRSAVESIKDRLAAGDTYQVNLTVRAAARVAEPLALYAAMARAQGGSYNAFIETGKHVVVCASPELFFERDGGRLVTRPMKGTSRRGRWPAEDQEVAGALAASPKDQAEHVMIVDLLRNDLGRLASLGTVRVESYADLERYPTVWQLTSTIACEIEPAASVRDVFSALFPCGSVTGAPKPRTMQIITQLEDSPRGVYCGAVGYLAPGDHRARFAVAIRTATVDCGDGRATYGAGGGVTWGSDPAAEWQEVLAKCSILEGSPAVTGLFETLRFEPDCGPVDLERHLARLSASAAYFGIPLDVAAASDAVHRACLTADGPRRLRLSLWPGGEVEVELGALPPPATGPVRLGLATERVDSRDVRLFHKLADRSRYERVRAGIPGTDDVLMVNERDEITETTICNVAVELDGRWCTPPLGCGLLPGVARQHLLDDGVLHERVVTLAEMRRATGVAVVNSLRGWRPAVLSGGAGPGRCG